jgi:hypothetical protein
LTQPAAERQRDVVIERAGVGLLVGNTQLGQEVKKHIGLDFQLAGQLINADLTHTWLPGSSCEPGYL